MGCECAREISASLHTPTITDDAIDETGLPNPLEFEDKAVSTGSLTDEEAELLFRYFDVHGTGSLDPAVIAGMLDAVRGGMHANTKHGTRLTIAIRQKQT